MNISKNLVFTICTKSYLSLASTLYNSIRVHYGSVDFVAIIVDYSDDLNADFTLVDPKTFIDPLLIDQLSFKYDVTEFCTSIKATCFQFFLNSGANKVLYFDPDIYCFDSIGVLFDSLDNRQLILTPHILDPRKSENLFTETNILQTGMMNLGFMGVSNSPNIHSLLVWWEQRLFRACYRDVQNGFYTDQLWSNYFLIFFDNQCDYYVARNPGLNVAPWNISERELVDCDGKYFIKWSSINGEVNFEPLVFFHFSGLNFSYLNNTYFPDWATNLTLKTLVSSYLLEISQNHFFHFLKLKYKFDYFINNTVISIENRRLYRVLLEQGVSYKNPFSISADSFYAILINSRLINKNIKKYKNIEHYRSRLYKSPNRFLSLFFKCLLYIGGPSRFYLILRFMNRFGRIENHLNLVRGLNIDSLSISRGIKRESC
jgi:hypothetical protein